MSNSLWRRQAQIGGKDRRIKTTLDSTSFGEFGSLYYAKDVVQSALKDLIYTESTRRLRVYARFSIGPRTNRKSLDNDRAKVNFNRGPC